MLPRVLPLVMLTLLAGPVPVVLAQSSIGSGAAAGLDSFLEEQRRMRQLEQERQAREREYHLQQRALDLQERRNAAVARQAAIRLSADMSADDFLKTGLHKLTATELTALDAWLSRRFAPAPVSVGAVMPTERVIEARINGDFDGVDYGRVYRLDNGQVWEQTSATYHYHYAYAPKVLIYQRTGAVGYTMRIDGVDREITVVRLK